MRSVAIGLLVGTLVSAGILAATPPTREKPPHGNRCPFPP
jgi:hypothetical protein